MSNRTVVAGAVAVPIGLGLAVVLMPFLILGVAGAGTPPPPTGVICGHATPETAANITLDADQMTNVKTIIATAADYDDPHTPQLPPAAAVVALATAYQESKLRNLDYGDSDSLGLFQQRITFYPVAVATDPAKSTRAFLSRLVRVPHWQRLPVTVAAAQVQRPAEEFRNLYAQWEPLARELTNELWPQAAAAANNNTTGDADATASTTGCVDLGDCPPTGLTVEAGLTPDGLRVLRCVQQRFGTHTYGGIGDRPAAAGDQHATGHAVDIIIDNWNTPAGNTEGWAIATWLKHNHTRLGVKYVIFDAQIWSVARTREGWRTYTPPVDDRSATWMHRDHVHVSVNGDTGTSTSTWVSPIAKGVYTLTSRYGTRPNPTGAGTDFHTGLDFSAPTGTPIVAAVSGTVTSAGWAGNYGNLVIIETADGTQTYYAHQADGGIRVQVGQTVSAGERIGTVGATGRTTGAHLHFEVQINGHSTDPYTFLTQHGVQP